MNVNVALDAAPNTAPIATSANAAGANPAFGARWFTPIANAPPSAADAMNIGPSNPPDVPDPSEINSASDFNPATASNICHVSLFVRMSEIVSYPTPSTRGKKYPITPSPTAPI